ncbi:LUD domain-containing protein [Emcibacter sp. SYSU 3D8]|uniref:LutC/YkgG family protein n=1 Tax=Emcibacter sp. SYSU 3D8 TaxID=3133969 RepID=UPI0031FEE362
MAAGSRAEILGKLRAAVPRHAASLAPQGTGFRVAPAADAAEISVRFAERLAAARGTLERVGPLAGVPGAVARYLADQSLPARLNVAPELRPLLDFSDGALAIDEALPIADGRAVLAGCIAGVAETGTLVVVSGPEHDPRLNYLAETLIVLVGAGQLVEAYEDVWKRLGVPGNGIAPRLVSFITGPSRTADIEQTIEWGAHGPRRVHVLISDETPT